MNVFKRSDLVYKDYSWETTEGDSAKVTGFPDNVLLNRKEGYEVISFINRFIDSESSWRDSDNDKRVLGNKVEKLIHDKLPGDIRSQKKVHEWIKDNLS